MKHYIYSCLFVLSFISGSGFAAPLNQNGSYWQCITEDKTNRQWIVKNSYQKVAINLSFEQCKKESDFPSSCKSSKSGCEGFYLGMSTRPLWRCTSIDHTAEPWNSNFYSNRDDAALAAQAFCKQSSPYPETCFMNMVTCRNYNEGVKLQ